MLNYLSPGKIICYYIYMSLETFYSVFNEKISDLSINLDNGNLRQSVRQDKSSAEYTPEEFHEISRAAAQALGEILRNYETDEIIGIPDPVDPEQVRLPVAELDSVAFSHDLNGIEFDAASHEVRDYLFNVERAFNIVWDSIDHVIRLESRTDIELSKRQQFIAEEQSLIGFIKDNALKPFVQALRDCKSIKEEDFINIIAKIVNSMADMKIFTYGCEAKTLGNPHIQANFISAYQAIMKEVFGEDVKLKEEL